MTSRAVPTVLRLSPSGRQWIRQPLTSLNLSRHGRPPLPPPPSPSPTTFETLASETTPVPSIQSVPAPAGDGTATSGEEGSRTGTPIAGAVPVPQAGAPALAQETVFRGVKVPKKPPPPAEGECCMSGCATCVYDLYLDDLEHFHSQAREARSKILDLLRAEASSASFAPPDLSAWPAHELGSPPTSSELRAAPPSSDTGPKHKVAEDPAEAAEREAAEARNQISDPTLRAFLEMEARMKKKQVEQQKKEEGEREKKLKAAR
ncbi:hypothetical protein JCM10908_000136 [Rhodotorula pacifica]|uniref:Dpc25p n=1 Tax=Rhodotorula pacifica TaxID=1495444 RepID=UPI0031717B33